MLKLANFVLHRIRKYPALVAEQHHVQVCQKDRAEARRDVIALLDHRPRT